MHRAITHYGLALEHWGPGHEILAFENVFIAAETLAEVAVHAECDRRSLEKDALAIALGVKKRKLKSWAIENIIFKGDNEAFRKADKASNGYEHGFMSFKDVGLRAKEVVEVAARYVRSAIVATSGVESAFADRLLHQRYHRPRDVVVSQQIRGVLVGHPKDFAPVGRLHPALEWNVRLKGFNIGDSGEHMINHDQAWKARLGPSVQFRPVSYELWSGKP